MSDKQQDGVDRIEFTENGVKVTVKPRFGKAVTGWLEAKEDLGLNPAGPEAVEGVGVVKATPHYHDDDDKHPYGYGPVTLRFEDADALEKATSRLYDMATERFEWGDASGGEDVQRFAGQLPTKFDVESVRNSREKDTE